MTTEDATLFRVPSLSDLGTTAIVYPLPLMGAPVSLASEAPTGHTLMVAMLTTEERISFVTVRFFCPTGFALELKKNHYTHATLKQVHSPEGNRFDWIRFGDENTFEVIN